MVRLASRRGASAGSGCSTESSGRRGGGWVKRRKRVASILALLAIGVLVWFFAFTYVTYPKRFTVSAWQTKQNRRISMANDLVGSKTLIGLSRKRVTRLLGAPVGRQRASVLVAAGALSSSKTTVARIKKRLRNYFGMPAKASPPSTVDYYDLGRTFLDLGRQRARLLVGYRNGKVVAATVKDE